MCVLLLLVGCNDFLDTLPDNRTEIDNADKVAGLLTSAYSNRSYASWLELSSDNIDDMGEKNPHGSE